jgi:chromosome partitioning protein
MTTPQLISRRKWDMAQTVAISNQKGGVAKTTTCLSLGACLAELGYRVLVIDMDTQSHLTIAAGFDPNELTWTIVDLLDTVTGTLPEAKAGVVQPSRVEGLDILPADVRLASTERLLYDQEGYEMSLARVLAPWQEEYNYILFDCPPSLGGLTLMALTAAQYILVPVQCEYFAIRSLNRLLDIITVVQERTNSDLSYHLVATMYDQRNSICRQVLNQLQTHFPEWLLDTVIGVDTRLRECPATGEPIILYAPHTRASQQYRQLAQELSTKISTCPTITSRGVK